jgi:eukaryotic-like serine/threonine-protein kinase
MTDTLRYVPEGFDDTMVSRSSLTGDLPTPEAAAAARRSTVLPRVEWKGDQPNVVPFQRERFEELRSLGQGGMGEVVLLKDNDIERMVALKRLPEQAGVDRLLRFVEEIRTVGQLDHPNIVPLHDVGVDERGRYYFVMKHLQGETLESIIARLREGDRATHERYTFPMRVQLFLGVLHALEYAHRKGIIHRDLKPANIMVGPYGEVTVLDWGLARQVRRPGGAGSSSEHGGIGSTSLRESASLLTQYGAVVGTPLCMSPEQARGEHDKLDERSDIYSLCVVFHEFLYLRHYLEGRDSLTDILEGVRTFELNWYHIQEHPTQETVPAELLWFIGGGLAKDPAKRYQSVGEMVHHLKLIAEGRISVQCSRTMLKRMFHSGLHIADKYPRLMMSAGMVAAGLSVFGMIQLLRTLL